MKVLLDENLPHDLRHLIPHHEVFTVAYLGWAGITNGELLKAAATAGFHVLVSKDSGIEFEQNVGSLTIAVILLKARSNSLDHIRPLLPQLMVALDGISPGTLIRVSV
jgi:predicted nuclease of predicted toxin-antitoxin system